MLSPPSFCFAEIIKWGQTTLLKNGISNAKKEIEWFLKSSFNYNIVGEQAKQTNIPTLFPKQHKTKFIQFIKKRINKEPFQYIIEKAPFYDKEFIVSRDVLIPRPETEIIIEILKKKAHTFNKCLDIGTGSGNLATIISLHHMANTIIATDVSKQALKIAKKNIDKFQVSNIKLVYNNFLTGKIKGQYDLIVSNPPYISQESYEKLDETVKKYEPTIALTDLSDGNCFYKTFAHKLKTMLMKGGVLLIEIGINQNTSEIELLFYNQGFNVTWHKDYNQQIRVAEVQYA